MSKHALWSLMSSSTGKLTATYLGIIMVMSIGFSIVFYNTSSQQFDRPLPPTNGVVNPIANDNYNRNDVREFIQQRFQETRDALLIRLMWLNLLALVLGGLFSYALARWTLCPIEESLEAQNQFVTDASHELRTPLTMLQTTNEVAKRKSKLTKAETNILIDQNIEEIKKLKDLTNSLLELLKNDSKDIGKVASNIQDIVAESMGTVVNLAQSKDIEIEDKTPPFEIKTEPTLLSRVITILLDNAIKYSDTGKKITISAERTDGYVGIQISDQGIGMKASDIPFIFRRFYRADKSRTSQDIAGYGLGLAIADKIVNKLGGKIAVESKLGKGSVFTIRLQ